MTKSTMCLGKSRPMWLDSRVEMYVGGGGAGKRETCMNKDRGKR